MTTACTVRAGTVVTPEELAGRDTWTRACFERAVPGTSQPGLLVIANNDDVWKNNRGGKPLNLAGTQYTRAAARLPVSAVLPTGVGETQAVPVDLTVQ